MPRRNITCMCCSTSDGALLFLNRWSSWCVCLDRFCIVLCVYHLQLLLASRMQRPASTERGPRCCRDLSAMHSLENAYAYSTAFMLRPEASVKYRDTIALHHNA